MTPPTTTLLGHLRRLTHPPAADAELLSRWVQERDETAFAVLVSRHGPMVMGVCRRVLGDVHEAEDAFQATFLILARKAASLRRPEALACWLHGVAARLARKARAAGQKRAGRSRTLTGEPSDTGPDPLDQLTVREMLGLIDKEIRALREVYRLPVVLCDLEGRTQEEAAGLLGWTISSLRNRLQRARARLKARLSRRGLTLPAGIALPLVPAALSASLSSAGPVVSPQHIAAVTRAAVRFAADSGAIPLAGPAVELAKEGLRLFVLAKVKIAAVVLVAMTLCAAGAGLLGRQMWLAREASLAPQDAEALGALTQPRSPALTQPRSPDAKAAEQPPARLDPFGNPLPEGAVARLGTVLFRHGREVRGVAFSPDRRTLASSGQDNTVRIWEIATGKELRRFTAVTGLGSENAWVSSVAYSPDGKFLAAGTMNGPGEVVIWELATGKEARPLRMNRSGVACLAFSPDGAMLAAGTQDGLVHLWDAETRKLLRQLKGHQEWIESIAFTEDSKMLASACRDKTIRLWDPATGRELRQLKRHTDMVTAVAFAHDGKTLASGCWDGSIRLWDSATGKELRELTRVGAVSTLIFLPDDKTLASGGWDSTIRLWDTATGKERRQMHGCTSVVTSLAVSPDGKTLASGSWDRIVRLWDVAKGVERRPTQGSKAGLWVVALTPDGQRVATGGEEGVVRIWDAASGKEIRQLIEPNTTGPMGSGTLRMIIGDRMHFAADGKSLSVSSGYSWGRWDTDTGKQIQRKRYNSACCLCPTPDGKLLIGTDLQESYFLLDAATGKTIRQFKKAKRVSVSAVSADGKYLAFGSAQEDGTVVIWELATDKERCRCKGAPHMPYTLAFSPDGKYLAGTTANLQFHTPQTPIYVWDAATGQEIRQFQTRGHYVDCLVYSSDGRMLVSGGEDKTIRLWETATGKERRRLDGHQGAVRSVALSADGTRLASASDDTTALVWDTTAPTIDGKLSDKQLQTAWNDLASDDAAKAYRAIWLLARHPAQSVPLLREQVPPARAVDAESRKQMERWLSELDSEEATVRDRAGAELEKRVVMAEPLLRKTLTGRPSLEQRKRIERVLERLEREKVTLGRAVEVLERASTPESRQLLETLTAGEPGAWLTQEAKAALIRRVGNVSNPH